MVQRICEVFGTVNKLDLLTDPSGKFTGIVNLEFGSEVEARRA